MNNNFAGDLIQGHYKDRELWLAERRKMIGSSDISCLLGLDEYRSAYDVWLDKTGKAQPFEGNEFTKRGVLLQTSILNYYREARPEATVVEYNNQIFKHKKCKFAGASPDGGILEDAHALNPIGVVEAKSAKFAVDKDDMPKKWFCQTTWQAGVMGVNKCATVWIAAMDFNYVEYNFDKEFFLWMLDKAERFWTKNIQRDIPPKATNPSDLIKLYRKARLGKVKRADDKLIIDCMQLRETKTRLNEFNEFRITLEDKIKLKMKDADTLTHGDNVLATWKSDPDGYEFDVEAFMLAHPKTYKKFVRLQHGSRRFLLK